MLVTVRNFVCRGKVLAPELIYFESALVHVKVYVSLLEIRCAGFPDLCLGVQSLYGLPRSVTNALAVLLGIDKKYLKLVVSGLAVYLQNYASGAPPPVTTILTRLF